MLFILPHLHMMPRREINACCLGRSAFTKVVPLTTPLSRKSSSNSSFPFTIRTL